MPCWAHVRFRSPVCCKLSAGHGATVGWGPGHPGGVGGGAASGRECGVWAPLAVPLTSAVSAGKKALA